MQIYEHIAMRRAQWGLIRARHLPRPETGPESPSIRVFSISHIQNCPKLFRENRFALKKTQLDSSGVVPKGQHSRVPGPIIVSRVQACSKQAQSIFFGPRPSHSVSGPVET